jgi:light-regulated signal transduction histidine kinase (bacteriophytochrome)
LRRANSELEEFAFIACHDLKEPLRMIGIYTQLMLQHCGEDEQVKQFSQEIKSNVVRMERLIQDVFLYSRAIHDDGASACTAPLRAAADQAFATFRDKLDAVGAEVEIGELPTVTADIAQMATVFHHLISNSLKYADSRRRLKIRVWAQPVNDGTDRWAAVHFADNGQGFEPEFAERIFGLFKRLHGREVPGTGVGLAISRRIVEKYGGEMWAERKVKEGATFTFTVKLAKSHAAGDSNIAR